MNENNTELYGHLCSNNDKCIFCDKNNNLGDNYIITYISYTNNNDYPCNSYITSYGNIIKISPSTESIKKNLSEKIIDKINYFNILNKKNGYKKMSNEIIDFIINFIETLHKDNVIHNYNCSRCFQKNNKNIKNNNFINSVKYFDTLIAKTTLCDNIINELKNELVNNEKIISELENKLVNNESIYDTQMYENINAELILTD